MELTGVITSRDGVSATYSVLVWFQPSSNFVYLFTNLQHPVVKLADHGSTLLQFLVDRCRLFLISFIAKLMVKVGPIIHCCSSKLQFQSDPLIFVLKWNCDFQDQMKTLITGFFGLFDIVFDLDDTDILLLLDQISYFIDIVHIGTDGTDTD